MISTKKFGALAVLALVCAWMPSLAAPDAVYSAVSSTELPNPKLGLTQITLTPAAQKKLTAKEYQALQRSFSKLLAQSDSLAALEDELNLVLKKMGIAAHDYCLVGAHTLVIDIQRMMPLVVLLELQHNNLYGQLWRNEFFSRILKVQGIEQGNRLPVDFEEKVANINRYLKDEGILQQSNAAFPYAGGVGSKMTFYARTHDEECGGRITLQVCIHDKKTTHLSYRDIVLTGNHNFKRETIIAAILEPFSLEATLSLPSVIRYYYKKDVLARLKDFYTKQGYLEMVVAEEKFSQQDGSIAPQYHITIVEGPRYTAQNTVIRDLHATLPDYQLSAAEIKQIQQIVRDIPPKYTFNVFQDKFVQLAVKSIGDYLETQNRIGSQIYIQQLVDQPTQSMQCIIDIRGGIQAPLIRNIIFDGQEINLISARSDFQVKVGTPYRKAKVEHEVYKIRSSTPIKGVGCTPIVNEDKTVDLLITLVPFPEAERKNLNLNGSLANNLWNIIVNLEDRNFFYTNLPFGVNLALQGNENVFSKSFLDTTNTLISLNTAISTRLPLPLSLSGTLNIANQQFTTSFKAMNFL